jgi:hypothetical protein
VSWARIDDGFHDHRKVVDLDLAAVGLWTLCLTWAHKARKTAPTPGLVPKSVVRRFAGARAKKLSGELVAAGLWDEETPGGWPIHDFDAFLPRYDSEQAKAAGSAGGKARAAKQTASKPLGDPLTESQADRLADSSTRASARRNPVPVPGPEEPTGSPRFDPESLVTRENDSPAIQVVKRWARASRQAGFNPVEEMTTWVGNLALNFLAEGNDLELTLEAADLAGAKGSKWLLDFVGPAIEARRKRNTFHDDKGNPTHSPPPKYDPFAGLVPGDVP